MTVLCYHSVQPDWASPLAVDPEAFARQAAWLREARRVLPLRDALLRVDSVGRLPRGEAALTFDDGFSAVHTHAFPVLVRERLPATMFLVAETLTPGGHPVDWVDTPAPEPLTTLTLEQILEMQEAGVDFQPHSWAHHDLTRLSPDECLRDLRESRELLSDLLGRAVTVLAYPRGRHNRAVREAAARAGYTHALALPERRERPDRYAVPRVGIYRGNGQVTMRIKASRPYLRVRTSDRMSGAAGRARRALAGVRGSRR